MADTRDKKKFSKDTFTTVGESEGFQPKGDQKDPTIGPGKNGKTCYCGCDPCTCNNDKKKKEIQIKRDLLINRMIEKGFDRNQIKTILKEMESIAVEKAEEVLGKDLDNDGEKGESKAHKDKVLGKKESTQAIIDRMVERGMTPSQIKLVLKEMLEKATNPYAIGMSQAEKETGDKPPLKKSTIIRGHKIAKAIKKDK